MKSKLTTTKSRVFNSSQDIHDASKAFTLAVIFKNQSSAAAVIVINDCIKLNQGESITFAQPDANTFDRTKYRFNIPANAELLACSIEQIEIK